MLLNFRDKLRGGAAMVVVGILAIPFALFGIDSLFLSDPAADGAVSVNGEEISNFQVEQGIVMRRQQILNQFEGLDPTMLGDEQLRGPVLDALIRETLINQVASKQGMAVSERTFRDVVVGQDAFRRDGRFDPVVYEYTLGRMGYTPRTYRQAVERELLANQFMGGIFASTFATPVELEQFIALSLEERDFHYLRIPVASFADDIVISDEEVAAYYREHGTEFDEPEKVTLDYIELQPDSLTDSVEVGEAEIRAQFDAEVEALAQDTLRWRISHIQLSEQPDGGHEEIIAQIQERLAAGEAFADLAREFSEDAGSAQQGGELGVFAPGTLPESFETALETLEEGQISEPVTTDSGVHLVRLEERRDVDLPVYEDERERIRTELVALASRELLPRMVEELKEKTFHVEDLAEVADELGLQSATTEPFSRGGGEGIAANGMVVTAAFSEDVLEHGFASEVLTLQDQHFVVVKLREHHPARRKSLDEVRDSIVATLSASRAEEMARAQADTLLAKAREGATIESLALEGELDWQVVLKATRFDAPVEPTLLQAVFAQPGTDLPRAGQVVTNRGDVVVYSLSRIHTGDSSTLAAEERRNLESSLEQMMLAREWRAYEDILLANAKIK